jgi:hypothetical protein
LLLTFNALYHYLPVRDPTVVAHAEDLQAGSSYNIPANTQQAFGTLRAADEIIDEGHFIGKALGEGMNGYRPVVELMNANFGIYGRGVTPPLQAVTKSSLHYTKPPHQGVRLVTYRHTGAVID